MQLNPTQLNPHLVKGLKSLYTLHGDEPLLIQEALDAIRVAARSQGFTERSSFTVSGAHFDWSEVLAAGGSLSLFADKQILELRIPSGKPGKEGSTALQQLVEQSRGNDSTLTLVILPRLDRMTKSSAWFAALESGITLEVSPVERAALPQWIAQRLAAQGQRVKTGEEGQRSLQFFADRVEGNLLAAHQEIQKLALLYPEGHISNEQIRNAVLNVARYDVDDLREALLAGDLPRLARTLEGLHQEGEAPVLVLWAMTEEIRTLAQAKGSLARGQSQDSVFRELRIWGPRQGLVRKALLTLNGRVLKEALTQAARLDRCIKGLENADVWDGFLRLGLLLTPRQNNPRQ